MPIFKKLNFCPYLVRILTQTLKKTLRRLSGDSQKASPSSLEASGGPDQSWSKSVMKPLCFTVKSDATEHFAAEWQR